MQWMTSKPKQSRHRKIANVSSDETRNVTFLPYKTTRNIRDCEWKMTDLLLYSKLRIGRTNIHKNCTYYSGEEMSNTMGNSNVLSFLYMWLYFAKLKRIKKHWSVNIIDKLFKSLLTDQNFPKVLIFGKIMKLVDFERFSPNNYIIMKVT